MLSLAQPVKTPYLLVRKYFQAPGLSYVVEWASEILHAKILPFLTILYWNYLIKYLFFPVDFMVLKSSDQISACCTVNAQ